MSRFQPFSSIPESESDRNTEVLFNGCIPVLGFVVRWTVLTSIGLFFYSWIPEIADVPFSQLTLREVVDAVLGVCAIVATIVWASSRGKKSYTAWGWLGALAIGSLALYWLSQLSNRITS
jgi:hypothetical protein